jgi:hypothetical protein
MNSGANSGWGERPREPARQEPRPTNPEDRETGLPGLRTWRAVYVWVLVLFAVDILLLVALERIFS